MKVRNKKTGQIIESYFEHIVLNTGSKIYAYDSIKELNDEWEDVETYITLEERLNKLEAEVRALCERKGTK